MRPSPSSGEEKIDQRKATKRRYSSSKGATGPKKGRGIKKRRGGFVKEKEEEKAASLLLKKEKKVARSRSDFIPRKGGVREGSTRRGTSKS